MAQEAYLQWTGTSTTMKPEFSPGTSTFRTGHNSQMPILRIDYGVSVPWDVTTGMTKGKRVHAPIMILKEIGASSPLHLKVLTGNELLKSVIFSLYTIGNDGADLLNYTITLTNAHIVKLRLFTGYAGDAGDASSGATAKQPGQYDTLEMEELHFTFETIQKEHAIAKTIAVDSWLNAAPTG
jgi:type VI secretion system secreted protein Hcp